MRKTKKTSLVVLLTVSISILILFVSTIFVSAADEKIPGDVNGDGSVTLDDIIMVRQYLAGAIELTTEQQLIADIYGKDGKVDLNDAIRMEQYLSGMDVVLEKNYHNIVYHNVDNAVNPNSAIYNADNAAFPLNDAEKLGYKFIGWYRHRRVRQLFKP